MIFELSMFPVEFQQQLLNNQSVQIVHNGQLIAQLNTPKSYAKGDFDYDLERMKQAVESGLAHPIHVPKSALKDIEAFDKWLNEVGA